MGGVWAVGRVYLVPVASPLLGLELIYEVLSRYVGSRLPVDEVVNVVAGESAGEVPVTVEDLAVVAPITGGTEGLILRVAERAGYTLIVPHMEMNSLPASLEAYSLLRLTRKRATLIVEWPPSQRVSKFINSWRAVSRVSSYVIGVIGDPSPWLVYSAGEEVERALKGLMPNLKIARISLSDLAESFSEVRGDEVKELAGAVSAKALNVRVSHSEVEKSLKVYVALKKLITKHRLNALTIRCFDLIKNVGTTPCLALSLLNSEGLVAGCEGDLSTLITMAILKELSGKPVFMGNISWVENSEILMSHCTIALKMVEKYELDTHFETRVGVGVSGHILQKPTATIAKLDPLTRTLRIAKGQVISGTPSSPRHCRTQLKIRVPGKLAPRILEKPTGNHHALVLGDLETELHYTAEILGVTVESPA